MVDRIPFETLLGKTFRSVSGEVGGELVTFITEQGEEFRMFHDQDCCESVYIEDICGELSWLVGSPVTLAEESSNSDDPPPADGGEPDSYTWTFYRVATAKGLVVIRWYGESNGYYSESVDLYGEVPA
jgi:hypothetical protein